MIDLRLCRACGGIGHDADCQCRDAVGFICGCCKTCGGEGVEGEVAPPPTGIVDQYGRPFGEEK